MSALCVVLYVLSINLPFGQLFLVGQFCFYVGFFLGLATVLCGWLLTPVTKEGIASVNVLCGWMLTPVTKEGIASLNVLVDADTSHQGRYCLS